LTVTGELLQLTGLVPDWWLQNLTAAADPQHHWLLQRLSTAAALELACNKKLKTDHRREMQKMKQHNNDSASVGAKSYK
jgi:hypothetical protein